MKDANLALRFLIEVTALVIFAYWGWKTGNGAMRWAVAIGAVAAAVVVWALFVSEGPAIAIPRSLQFVIELAVWVAAGGALYAVGHARLAVAFVGVAVASGVLNYVWERSPEAVVAAIGILLLNAVDCRLGMLAEVLDPGALDARVVLGRLDQVHEAGNRHLETSPKLLVRDFLIAASSPFAGSRVVGCS